MTRNTLHTLLSMAAVALSVLLAACSGSQHAGAKVAQEPPLVCIDSVSADSLMAFARTQVAFGPRVPGTPAHDACADWLVSRLGAYGADTVCPLEHNVTAWEGTRLPVRNIFARFNTTATPRMLLLAHYDTRPWADQEEDPALRDTPFDGANDGASGVAVILEVLRRLQADATGAGVDVLFTDVEDYGRRADTPDAAGDEDTWCLGSTLFAQNLPYTADDVPAMGILLDMVGGSGAIFAQEYFSANYAQKPTALVWNAARRLGLQQQFPARRGGAVTDDHLPLIRAGIPVTDIIEAVHPATGSFNPTWHTHADRLDALDPTTMQAVAAVVLQTIKDTATAPL